MSRSWSSAHDWKSCRGQKLLESSNLSISAKRKARLSAGFSFGGDGEPALCAGSIRFARFAGREYTIPSRPAPCKSGLRSSDEADRDSNHVRTGRGPVRSPVRTLVNSSMFRTVQHSASPRRSPAKHARESLHLWHFSFLTLLRNQKNYYLTSSHFLIISWPSALTTSRSSTTAS